jgi:hypothetical protein
MLFILFSVLHSLPSEQDRRSREGDRQTIERLDSRAWLAGFTAPAFSCGLHFYFLLWYSMDTRRLSQEELYIQYHCTSLSLADTLYRSRSISIWTGLGRHFSLSTSSQRNMHVLQSCGPIGASFSDALHAIMPPLFGWCESCSCRRGLYVQFVVAVRRHGGPAVGTLAVPRLSGGGVPLGWHVSCGMACR